MMTPSNNPIYFARYIAMIGLIFTTFSCEETFILPTENGQDQIVIEALVTDQPGRQFVKISRSVDFYQDGQTPRVTNAEVSVSDNEGNSYIYTHAGDTSDRYRGVYVIGPSFVGKAGNTYTLNVSVDGQEYTATDELFAVSGIDSLSFQIDEDEFEDPEDEGRFYEVLFYTTEPQDTKDYYLFRLRRNGVLYNDEDNEVLVTDDRALSENIDGVSMPGFFEAGDVATVEAFSLSRKGFEYFNGLNFLLNNDGGMFSQPPVNPQSNISNGALGYFQASSLRVASIRIEP